MLGIFSECSEKFQIYCKLSNADKTNELYSKAKRKKASDKQMCSLNLSEISNKLKWQNNPKQLERGEAERVSTSPQKHGNIFKEKAFLHLLFDHFRISKLGNLIEIELIFSCYCFSWVIIYNLVKIEKGHFCLAKASCANCLPYKLNE